MHQRNVLGGRVTVDSLPLTSDPTSLAPEVLKRLSLAQGELAQVHNGTPGIQYLAYIQLVAGTIRGNHYHQLKQEYIYLIEGHMELGVEDVQTGEVELLRCAAGDLVKISPGIAHVLRVLASGHGIEFSPQSFDRLDVHRYPVAVG